MVKNNKIWFIILCGSLISCYTKTAQSQASEENNTTAIAAKTVEKDTALINARLLINANKTIDYIKKSNVKYNNSIAFLVDVKIESKFKRFFIYDLKNKKVLSSGMMAHGEGSEIEGTDSLQFSNTPNSYMTSLGKYKVGISYEGQFGLAYKLHGLEKSNSKAFDRLVVLHRYQCVPDDEQTSPICYSLGCPMLSENYFVEVDKAIKSSKQPILVNIYY
jgi:hypothetical protein